MRITKREIILSAAIIALMMVLGFIISGSIKDAIMEKQQEYNTALKVDNNSDLFQYGMRTNIGNAFVYGDLRAATAVTYEEIGGEYASVTKITERYTRHTRTVTKTRTVNGKTQTYTETEVYWTWDEIDRDRKHSDTIYFLDVEFPWGTIDGFGESHIDTIKESSKIRYVYRGSAMESAGTVYAYLYDDTMSNVNYYKNMSIDETLEYLETGGELIAFWVFWIILIVLAVWAFYGLENRWLE